MIKYLLVGLLLVLPFSAVRADDTSKRADNSNIQIAGGVVCDSQAQVERLVSLVGGTSDPHQALAVVNREAANPRACGAAVIGFTNAKQMGTIREHGRTFRVMELTVVAVPTASGSWSLIRPVTQYAAIPVEEVEA